MSSIYSEIILDHYQNPRNFGIIKTPSKKVEVANPLCGDKISLMVDFEGDIVKDVKFVGSGCAISIASASLLTSSIKGKSKEQLQKIDKNFIIKMLGIELGVNRVKCALLPLEALKKILL
ncbi:MAG: Fe-S cluster assembly sulfur transfer protein SufU [Microgenomates group bacterium]